VRRLVVTANVVPSSPILVTLMMKALGSSETSVLIRGTRSNIQKTAFSMDDVQRHPGCISVTSANTFRYMKNGVFWDVTPCGSCRNRRFGGTYRLLHQGDKNR
jgi:hypothetical protein